MQFKDIIGQESVKEKLRQRVSENKVAHTQLFLGQEGSGTLPLAIAFAQYINCTNRTSDDSCGTCSNCIKYKSFAHPDLHFIFPTITSEGISKPKSELYLNEWRNYLKTNGGYITQNGWWDAMGLSGNKQGSIYVRDASDIIEKLSVKPYESEYKVVIIYLPEKLNSATANKLLKTFEEPPEKSLIIMVAERYELLLPTVRSRAQLLKIPRISDDDILEAIEKRGIFKGTKEELKKLVSLANGNWNKALHLTENLEEEQFYFQKFRQWTRLCFQPGNFVELMTFNKELARLPREKQKRLLAYGLEVIHNSILSGTGLGNRMKIAGDEGKYVEKFSPFINESNRNEVYELLNGAIYHLERNVNSNILFGHLSLQMALILAKGKKALKS